MQGVRLKRFVPATMLALIMLYSSSVKDLKFLPFFEPLVIKAIKNSPPHIAFEEIYGVSSSAISEDVMNDDNAIVHLNTERSSVPLFAKRIYLSEMTINAPVENLRPLTQLAEESIPNDDRAWTENLSQHQLQRLQEAKFRGLEVDKNWHGQTWTEHAEQVLKQVKADLNNQSESPVEIFKIDDQGRKVREVPLAEIKLRDPLTYGQSKNRLPAYSGDHSDKRVADEYTFVPSLVDSEISASMISLSGPLEVTGGLALTNEHYIEVRRHEEGIVKELGRVDLVKGIYSIDIERPSGEIVARLMDRTGTVLGEGIVRINAGTAKISQKKLSIEPHIEYAGVVAGLYNTSPLKLVPEKTYATLIKGIEDIPVASDGQVRMANIAKNSFTVLRAAAPRHMQTVKMINSGKEFKAELFPETMIEALKEIVVSHRGLILDENFAVIWGQVKSGDKPVSGAEVVLETDLSLEPVYFNSLMLPDMQLTKTSENGYFAFIGMQPGMHSLLATREGEISYSNSVVELASVTHLELEYTNRKETIPLRVYDAFTGSPSAGAIALQSLEDEIDVASSGHSITLPYLNRIGLIYARPENPDYISAKYLYNDKDPFIHIPLIKEEWLKSIKNYLRLNDHPHAGTVVGFVPDEDFEVYLAEIKDFDHYNIVYFDMHGKILQNRQGIAGGGFIIYNLPADIHEVVVLGSRHQKIQSKVVAVDPSSVTTLIYRP